MTWLLVTASLSVQPMTEPQCKALAGKVATVRGHRVAACLSPEGAFWPSPLGKIAPANIVLAKRAA
jgi:hypothetical protein